MFILELDDSKNFWLKSFERGALTFVEEIMLNFKQMHWPV